MTAGPTPRWLLVLLAPAFLATCTYGGQNVPGVCRDSGTCGVGEVCIESVCWEECATYQDCDWPLQECGDMQISDNEWAAVCVARPLDCTTNADCTAPKTNRCETWDGAECIDGKCVYAIAPEGRRCTDGSRCTTNDTCTVDGTCAGVETCATQGTCPDTPCAATPTPDGDASCYTAGCFEGGCVYQLHSYCGGGTCEADPGAPGRFMATPPPPCTADGECLPAPSPRDCGAFRCNGLSDDCLYGCDADTECVAGHFCYNPTGECLPLKAWGADCSAPNQCESGHCTNGICCDADQVCCNDVSQCGDLTQSCDIPYMCFGTVTTRVCSPRTGQTVGVCDVLQPSEDPVACDGVVQELCSDGNTLTCDSSAGSATQVCPVSPDCQISGCGTGLVCTMDPTGGGYNCVVPIGAGTPCDANNACSQGSCDPNNGMCCAEAPCCTSDADCATSGFACDYGTGSCHSYCMHGSDFGCPAGSYCDINSCSPKKDLGSPCVSNYQCASGWCDSVTNSCRAG